MGSSKSWINSSTVSRELCAQTSETLLLWGKQCNHHLSWNLTVWLLFLFLLFTYLPNFLNHMLSSNSILAPDDPIIKQVSLTKRSFKKKNPQAWSLPGTNINMPIIYILTHTSPASFPNLHVCLFEIKLCQAEKQVLRGRSEGMFSLIAGSISACKTDVINCLLPAMAWY